MRKIQRGVGQMSLAMLISGTIGACVLFSGLPVNEVVFWRCLTGAITLFIVIRLSHSPLKLWPRKALLLAALGGVALVINWLLLFGAYSRATVGLATVVYNTQPLMLVIMSMLLGERVSRVKWGWLLVAFAGVGLVLSSALAMPSGADWLTGILMALGAAFFYAITAIITRQLRPMPPTHIAFVQVLTGTVMLLPLTSFSYHLQLHQWAIIAVLGIVHTGVMYQLLYSAIQKLPTPLIGSLSFIYPLVAVLIDKLLFGHALSLLQLAGGVLILLAAAGNNLGWGEKRLAETVSGRQP